MTRPYMSKKQSVIKLLYPNNLYTKYMNNIFDLNRQGNFIEKKAYAKINLALDVTGRLDNGYHLVKMIMESISIHDVVTITCSEQPGIRMTCNRPELTCGEDNLVIRAAKAILDEADIPWEGVSLYPEKPVAGLDIKLEKNIPMAAGLAGGSTDAAAVLKGINELYGLGYSSEELCSIGVKHGADIPYCITGGSCLAEGIGEKLTLLSPVPKAYLVVIKPDMDVSTGYVYNTLDTEGVKLHPDVDGMINALKQGDLQGICNRLGNVLRDVTAVKYPIIPKLEQRLRDLGALNALMSGSGPTVFGIFENSDRCIRAEETLKKEYPEMFVKKAEFII